MVFSHNYLKAKGIFATYEVEEDLSFPFPPTSSISFTNNRSFEAYRDAIELRVNYLESEEVDPNHIDDLLDSARIVLHDVAYMGFVGFQMGFDLLYVQIKTIDHLINNRSPEQTLANLLLREPVGDFRANHGLSILTAQDENGNFIPDDHALEVSSNFASQIYLGGSPEETIDVIEGLFGQRNRLFEKTKDIVDELQLSR